jgi:hypothetical protein
MAQARALRQQARTGGLERFGIKSGVTDEFQSLTQARNCLSHRRGIVGSEDCTDTSKTKLVLELWKWRMFVTQPNGSEIDIDEERLSEAKL